MFGYGFVSVVLVLYLAAVGLPDYQIGLLLTLTLLGDAVITLWLTTHADRVGRPLLIQHDLGKRPHRRAIEGG